MRGHRLFAEADAPAQDQAEDQRAPARGHVDDRPPREVERRDPGVIVEGAVHQARVAPDHVRQREVNEKHPQGDEGHDRRELHPLGNRPDDERRGDDREHELVHGEHVFRHPEGVIGIRRAGHPAQEEMLAATQVRAVEVLAEDEAVAHRPP